MAKQTKKQTQAIEKVEKINNAFEKALTKETTKEEVQPVEEVVEVNTIENNTPEVEEKDNTQEENTNSNNTNKVERVLQRQPSHYRLLMEDGRQVVVHKSLFDRKNMIIVS